MNLDDNKRVASIGPTSVGYNILSQVRIADIRDIAMLYPKETDRPKYTVETS